MSKLYRTQKEIHKYVLEKITAITPRINTKKIKIGYCRNYDIVLIGESEEQSLLNLINNHCQGVIQTIQEVKVVINSFDGLHCLELYLHHSIDKNNYRFFEKLSGNFYIGRPLKINLGKVKISIEIESTY